MRFKTSTSVRFISTCVETIVYGHSELTAAVHLRAWRPCEQLVAENESEGSSPRAWRPFLCKRLNRATNRFISTCVETMPPWMSPATGRFISTCVETMNGDKLCISKTGSSPRAWRPLEHTADKKCRPPVHLHVRGDHLLPPMVTYRSRFISHVRRRQSLDDTDKIKVHLHVEIIL